MSSIRLIFISLATLFLSTAAFQVANPAPIQCSPFQISFNGATAAPPFNLLILPISRPAQPMSITLPDSAWNDSTKTGFFETTLPYSANTQFIVVMDDGKGQGTGGVSPVQTVLASANTTCLSFGNNPTGGNPNGGGGGGGGSPQRILSASPLIPTQCVDMTLSWPAMATGEPTIRGFIPLGNTFSVNMPGDQAQPTSTVFHVDVAAGNEFMLALQDSSGNILDTTPLFATSGNSSSDNSCITPNSPKVTATLPGVAGPSASVNAATSGKSTAGPSMVLLIGISAGGALIVIILVGFFIFWLRKRRNQARASPILPIESPYGGSTPTSSSSHLKSPVSSSSGFSKDISSPLYSLPSITTPKRPDRHGTNLLSFLPIARTPAATRTVNYPNTIGNLVGALDVATNVVGAVGGSPTLNGPGKKLRAAPPRIPMPVSPASTITSFGNRASLLDPSRSPEMTSFAPRTQPLVTRPSPLGERAKSPQGPPPPVVSNKKAKLTRPSTADDAASRPTTPQSRTNKGPSRPSTAPGHRSDEDEYDENGVKKNVRIKYMDLGTPGNSSKLTEFMREAEERALRSVSP